MHHFQSREPTGTSGPLQGQTVFRVPIYKSQRSLYPANGTDREPSDRVYHARRPHRKSRGGCLNCKQRRVKCDETKPCCLRCQKQGAECDYSSPPARSRPTKHVVTRFIESRPDLISVESLSSSMSLFLVADKLDELLRPPNGDKPSRAKPPPGSSTHRALEALHHFHLATSTNTNTKLSTTKDVVMRKVTQLAFQTPLLMHAIIGVAITHLCTLLPDTSPYRLAEVYHWQQTVKQYSTEVSHVTKNNMDTLFSVCLFLTIHTFTLEEFNPRASWVFSNDPANLNWLLLQGGLRFLFQRTGKWLSSSLWWGVFMEVHDYDIDFEDDRPGRVDLDPDLADLCGITETSTTENNPYLWPLRMLTGLLSLKPEQRSHQAYSMWMGRLEPGYLDCLVRKEPPALVLLAWWLALMSSLDDWWVGTRVRSECTAICIFLERSEDLLVRRLLEFPAERCGYLLRHLQGQSVMEVGDESLLVY